MEGGDGAVLGDLQDAVGGFAQKGASQGAGIEKEHTVGGLDQRGMGVAKENHISVLLFGGVLQGHEGGFDAIFVAVGEEDTGAFQGKAGFGGNFVVVIVISAHEKHSLGGGEVLLEAGGLAFSVAEKEDDFGVGMKLYGLRQRVIVAVGIGDDQNFHGNPSFQGWYKFIKKQGTA